jgi:hypothetical protein
MGDAMRKDRLDSTGIGALLAVSLLLAFNQIIVKYVNQGLPGFAALWRWSLWALGWDTGVCGGGSNGAIWRRGC